MPSILIVGTGAIGAIYGWRLSQSAQVTTVCRSNYSVVQEHGFSIDSKKFGQEVFRPYRGKLFTVVVRTVTEAVEANGSTPFDYILVTLKALPDMYSTTDIIGPAVTPGKTTIVLLQNGLGVEEPVVAQFPTNPLVSIVAYIGTSQTSPGHILMVGGEYLVVGNYLASKVDNTAQRQLLLDLFEKGGVTFTAEDDVERIRWQKLFWNAAFSSVCTLTGMNTTEVLNNKAALDGVKSVMKEMILTANAMGYDFDVESQMDAMIKGSATNVPNYKPSMQLDYERKQQMEVEVILGTPLRRAKAKGMAVPFLELIYNLCSAANARNLLHNTSSL